MNACQTPEELQHNLAEARKAYHSLLTGQTAVEYRDFNGEMVRYASISINRLMGYILSLERQLGCGAALGPMRVQF